MKKIFAILGTAVLAAAVLTGCSNSAGGNDSKITKQSVMEKVAEMSKAQKAVFASLTTAQTNLASSSLTMDNIAAAKKDVAELVSKVTALKDPAKAYATQEGNSEAGKKAEAACTDYLKALKEVETLLSAADTTTNKNKITEANTKFGIASINFSTATKPLLDLLK